MRPRVHGCVRRALRAVRVRAVCCRPTRESAVPGRGLLPQRTPAQKAHRARPRPVRRWPGNRRFARRAHSGCWASLNQMTQLNPLVETRGLASEPTQIIKLRAAHLSCAHHVNVVDHRSLHREDALDTVAEADLADRDGLAHPGVVAGDDGALEYLEALFIAFLDLDVHLDGVAGPELRVSRPFVLVQDLGDHCVLHNNLYSTF